MREALRIMNMRCRKKKANQTSKEINQNQKKRKPFCDEMGRGWARVKTRQRKIDTRARRGRVERRARDRAEAVVGVERGSMQYAVQMRRMRRLRPD